MVRLYRHESSRASGAGFNTPSGQICNYLHVILVPQHATERSCMQIVARYTTLMKVSTRQLTRIFQISSRNLTWNYTWNYKAAMVCTENCYISVNAFYWIVMNIPSARWKSMCVLEPVLSILTKRKILSLSGIEDRISHDKFKFV
jgi:hypothetical protein